MCFDPGPPGPLTARGHKRADGVLVIDEITAGPKPDAPLKKGDRVEITCGSRAGAKGRITEPLRADGQWPVLKDGAPRALGVFPCRLRKLPEPEQEFSVGRWVRLKWEDSPDLPHVTKEQADGKIAQVRASIRCWPAPLPDGSVFVRWAEHYSCAWPKRLLTRIDYCEKVKGECDETMIGCGWPVIGCPTGCPHHPRHVKEPKKDWCEEYKAGCAASTRGCAKRPCGLHWFNPGRNCGYHPAYKKG